MVLTLSVGRRPASSCRVLCDRRLPQDRWVFSDRASADEYPATVCAELPARILRPAGPFGGDGISLPEGRFPSWVVNGRKPGYSGRPTVKLASPTMTGTPPADGDGEEKSEG